MDAPQSSSLRNSLQLARLDAEHLLHPCHDSRLQADGLIWERGAGARLWDVHGREYLDGVSGLWNVLVGHGRAELVQAAAEQLRHLAFASTYAGSSNRPAIELSARLAELSDPDIRHFYFTTGGAEAIEAAFKTARYYWHRQGRPQKTRIIARRGDYHGTTFAALAASGMEKYLRLFEPRMDGFSWIELPPHFDPHAEREPAAPISGLAAADELEGEILRLGAEHVAAVVAEPIVGVGGVFVPPPDYWPRIRAICDRHDVLLIADEIVTGFGRCGSWFQLSRREKHSCPVTPDIVAFAKGITSGYLPLGGIGVSRAIGECITFATGEDTWLHAATCSGHPVACAVALANLEILSREELPRRAMSLGRTVHARLQSLAAHPAVAQVRGLGLLWVIELKAAESPRLGFEVQAAARELGLFTRARADLIHLAPCLSVSPEDLERMIGILTQAITSVC